MWAIIRRAIPILIVATVLLPSLFAATEEIKTTAVIHIDLPSGTAGDVAVAPGDGRIVLDLPTGAVLPEDFVAASGGFLAAEEMTALDGGRVRLALQVRRGALDRVVYRPDRVSLHLTSRFGLAEAADDQAGGYRLGPDDRIRVTVFNHPELSAPLTVSKEGAITVPLVGDVTATGLTARQLAARLADLLENYLVNPQVDVTVEEFNSQWVMVAGEVRLPGRVPLRGGTYLKDVLSAAQGFAEAAGETISISRRTNGAQGPTSVVVGRTDFERGLKNPRLVHGDIITVGRARFCYIGGEVRSPGRVEIDRDLTLLRAISIAGGLTDWASQKSVRIRAKDEIGPGQVYNLKKIRRGLVPDPPLTGGEVIHVGRRTL